MNIFKHPLCTDSIGAPSDMQNDCSALPVAYHTDEFGTWAVSFWKPDPDELWALRGGGGVVLKVRAAGRQHPVVAVGTYRKPTAATTLAQIAASDNDPDMGRGVDLVDEIQWCLDYSVTDLRQTACLARCMLALRESGHSDAFIGTLDNSSEGADGIDWKNFEPGPYYVYDKPMHNASGAPASKEGAKA